MVRVSGGERGGEKRTSSREGRGDKDEQDVRPLREDGLPDRGAQVPGQDMAQAVFQVSGLRYDPEHADVQGFQQTAILRGTHTKSQSHHDGGDTGAEAYCGEHEDTE